MTSSYPFHESGEKMGPQTPVVCGASAPSSSGAASAAHTPGPWKACWSVEADFYGIFPDTGRAEFPIAKMPEIILPEVNEANARLIAAAPDLLAACAALQWEARARGCGLRVADEAIAKASGTATDAPPPTLTSDLLAALIAVHAPYKTLTDEALEAGILMEFGPPKPDRGAAQLLVRAAIAKAEALK